jgi:hypothetical protein
MERTYRLFYLITSIPWYSSFISLSIPHANLQLADSRANIAASSMGWIDLL